MVPVRFKGGAYESKAAVHTMVSEKALRIVLRSEQSRAMWGDVIRGLVAFAVVLGCFNWIMYYVLISRPVVERQHMNDFGKFYYSARLFLEGQDMYDPTPATLLPVGPTEQQQFWNMNPPHFHLLVLPFALLDEPFALALWAFASLGALAWSIRIILRELRLHLTAAGALWAAFGLLSFAATGAFVVTWQLSLLLLLPISIAWSAARQERWTRAGAFLGLCMSVKPFLIVFLPYFILRRQVRVAAAAICAGALSFLAGLTVFGIEAHASWFASLSAVSWPWASMNASLLGLLARTLADSPYFVPLFDAPWLVSGLWIAGVVVIGAITLFVVATDRSEHSVDRAFFLLLIAAQLISPLGWVYYLWLPLGPAAALIASRATERGHSDARNRIDPGRWYERLFWLAVPGLAWPLPATLLFQPRPWATVLFGSAYFWGTLALWLGGVLHWRTARARSMRHWRGSHQLPV